MEKIGSYNPKAVEYLQKCTEQWSRHQFNHDVCYDHNTTNFVESFNAITKAYRDLSVLTVLEAVRSWCMKRIGSRFDTIADMSPQQLSEYASNILEVRGEESRLCYVTAYGGGEFEVRDEHVHFPIKLSTCICGCGKWQLSGIPCKHALRVIYPQRLEPADFVSPYFKGAAYISTYGHHMHPMPDQSQWDSFDLPLISPPFIKRSAGRPRKQRKRGLTESRKRKRNNKVKCSKCKEMGHNVKTCAVNKGKAATEASTSKTRRKKSKQSK